MRTLSKYCILVVAVIAVLLPSLVAVPVLADTSGLSVSGSLILADVTPGQTLTHTITVSIGTADTALDMSVQVGGMAQSSDGSYALLDAAKDTSQYSARSFVTIDKSSIHMDPGGSQTVTVTIQVPQDVSAGGRFAIINFASQPVAGGNGVGIISEINALVILTIQGSQLTHTGKITGLSTGNITSGQPVDILTDFQNTGNHYFKIKGEVAVSNASGQSMGTVDVPLTPGSVLPGMTRRLDASFISPSELAPGDYSISSKVMLDDGTVLDESTGSFEVKQVYVPPPGTIAALSVTPAVPAASSTAPASSSASSTPSAGTASGSNWMYPVLGVAGVIIVVLLVLLLRRKR